MEIFQKNGLQQLVLVEGFVVNWIIHIRILVSMIQSLRQIFNGTLTCCLILYFVSPLDLLKGMVGGKQSSGEWNFLGFLEREILLYSSKSNIYRSQQSWCFTPVGLTRIKSYSKLVVEFFVLIGFISSVSQ